MSEQKTKNTRGEERKDQNLHLRATKSQMEFLDILSYENEKTKTDMIFTALEFWHRCKKGSY